MSILTSSMLVLLEIAHALPKLLANCLLRLLKDKWLCVKSYLSPGVCFLPVSRPRGEYPWKPVSWSSSKMAALLSPTNCLVPTVLPAFTISKKNPLAQAHLSTSDLVSVHRMSNFPASLGGANCLLITYKLTHPPCIHVCTNTRKNKQTQLRY